MTKERESCEAVGWGLHLAPYNPWGGQGPAATALLKEVLMRATADLEGWPKIHRMMEIRQGISMTLARSVAAQLSLQCVVYEAGPE